MTCLALVLIAGTWVYQPTPCPPGIVPYRPVAEYRDRGCHQHHKPKRKPDWSWRKRWTLRIGF
jgi:hypothetical protein